LCEEVTATAPPAPRPMIACEIAGVGAKVEVRKTLIPAAVTTPATASAKRSEA
jgi:hypothetical protein